MSDRIADLHEDHDGLLELGEVREEVIRCGRCKWCDPEVLVFADGDDGSFQRIVAFCDFHRRETQLQNFCSWAERRKND